MNSAELKNQLADVSVIIVTRNGEKTIGRALDSIQSQTIAPAEVLVINNGSDDDTAEICRSHPLSLVIYEEAGHYLSKARNIAASHASRKWLTFLDDDDEWDAHHIATLLSSAKKTGTRIHLSHYRKYISKSDQYEERPPLLGIDRKSEPRVMGREDLKDIVLGLCYGWHLQGMCLDRRMYLDSGGCDEHMPVRADAEFFLRISSKEPWTYIPQETWTWFIEDRGSLSTRHYLTYLWWVKGHARHQEWLDCAEYRECMARASWEAVRQGVLSKRKAIYSEYKNHCFPWLTPARRMCAGLALKFDRAARYAWLIRDRIGSST